MILNIYPVLCLQHVLILLIVQQQLLLHVKLTQLLIMIFQQPCWSHSGTPLAYNFTFQLLAAIQDLSGAQHLFCRKFLRNYLSSQTVLHFIYVWTYVRQKSLGTSGLFINSKQTIIKVFRLKLIHKNKETHSKVLHNHCYITIEYFLPFH